MFIENDARQRAFDEAKLCHKHKHIKQNVRFLHSVFFAGCDFASLHHHRGVEQLAAREVHSLKAAGSSPAPATNLFCTEANAAADVRSAASEAEPNRMARAAVITSNSVNTYGTRVLTEGLDISQYEKNPIVLYMHQRGIPIGTMTDLRREDDKLIGTPEIDGDTDEEKVIASKWERGTLRMLSAGIEILEWSDDPQNLVQGQTRPTVTRSKLVEVSIVDIGANDDALQVRLYKGGKLLTLAAGEDNDQLPLLKPDNNKPQNKIFQMNDEILMLLGLPTTATEAEAATAIKALKTENETLALARITDAVTMAKDKRQITEEQMPKMIELGKKAGIDTLRDTLAMMTPAPKPMDFIGGNTSQGGSMTLAWDKLSDEQKMKLRDENRPEYIRLFKEHYGLEPNFSNSLQ